MYDVTICYEGMGADRHSRSRDSALPNLFSESHTLTHTYIHIHTYTHITHTSLSFSLPESEEHFEATDISLKLACLKHIVYFQFDWLIAGHMTIIMFYGEGGVPSSS